MAQSQYYKERIMTPEIRLGVNMSIISFSKQSLFQGYFNPGFNGFFGLKFDFKPSFHLHLEGGLSQKGTALQYHDTLNNALRKMTFRYDCFDLNILPTKHFIIRKTRKRYEFDLKAGMTFTIMKKSGINDLDNYNDKNLRDLISTVKYYSGDRLIGLTYNLQLGAALYLRPKFIIDLRFEKGLINLAYHSTKMTNPRSFANSFQLSVILLTD